jgi:hypothetical protein
MFGERLGEVLTLHGVTLGALSAQELREPITSYAASAGNAPFLLAYYHDDGSGMLNDELHLLRYDRRRRSLQRAALQGGQQFSREGVMSAVSSECLGAVLSISEADGYIAIDTHINPSSGCLLVLTTNLRFSAALYGWLTARIGTNLLFTESMVHFAPTHSERFSLYDPRNKHRVSIYPAPGDSARAAFSSDLEAHLPTPDFRARQNLACNPEEFSVDLDDVQVAANADSFSFEAHMSAEGFGEAAERLVAARTVRYVCHRRHGRWVLSTE